jgi:adenylosuccinate synthase
MKNSMALMGAQWGDEGKGKITDYFSEFFDYVVRYQGGANAGHTLFHQGEKIVLHLIPSGVLHQHCQSIIAHGVAFDPRAFQREVQLLEKVGVSLTPKNIKISSYCPVITSYHIQLDQLREQNSKVNSKDLNIGTTGKGIGPCYEDEVSRKGLKLIDLLNYSQLEKKLSSLLREKEILFQHLYQANFIDLKSECDQLFELGKLLKPFLDNTSAILYNATEQGKKIFYEGAQGILLDLHYGTYPYVTSSHPTLGGIYTGANTFRSGPDQIWGVAKVYTTRVGNGPFPTELHCEIGEKIQKKGNEFGATTGRKRRVGWLDLPLLQYAIKRAPLDGLILTKLDILNEFEELEICSHYEFEDQKVNSLETLSELENVKPVMKKFKGFKVDFASGENPLKNKECAEFLNYIQESLKIPIKYISVGPYRNQILPFDSSSSIN